MRAVPVGLLVLLLALVLGGGARPAGAEEVFFLDGRDVLPDAQRIRATFEATPPALRQGVYGFIHVRLHNPDPKDAHHFQVEMETEHGPVQGRFQRSAVVPAGQSTTVYLPIPSGTDWCYVRGRRDGQAPLAEISRFLSVGARTNTAVLGIDDPTATPRAAEWAKLLTKGPTSGAATHWRPIGGVPPSFPLLSGFDLILCQARAGDLPDELQRTLVQYVAAGGRLILANALLPLDGTLSALTTSLALAPRERVGRGAHGGRHGLGAWLVVADAVPDQDTFDGWWDEQATLGELTSRPSGGALPPFLWLPLRIPGLGDVPVLAFFVLLLLFALVAGPLSYVFFKRRRKLAWLLVTIPATGFLFSAAILLYGFFSEGFGISGAVRSFTMLDQRTHDAVVAAGRTLYAGLPVATIEPGGDTFLGILGQAGWDAPPLRLEGNLDTGFRLDGSALPSRTPTTMLTTTVGRARERLRFKRHEDGTYEVLAGPRFAPVVAEGAVLLRTPEGGYFVSTASGRLAPIGTRDVRRTIGDVLAAFGTMPTDVREMDHDARRVFRRVSALPGPGASPPQANEFAWVAALVGESLVPGSYVARVEAQPALDGLGLDVDVRAAEHVVFGLLDAEDFVP